MRTVIIGPAGSGKSTACELVSSRLGIQYVDSGSMYRALTAICLYKQIPRGAELLSFMETLEHGSLCVCGGLSPYLMWEGQRLLLRSPEVTSRVPEIASIPTVRLWVRASVKKMLARGACIISARSPEEYEPRILIWLDASLDVRAYRLCEAEQSQSRFITLNEARERLRARDQQDEQREAAPLYRPDYAFYINTDILTHQEVAEKICGIIKDHE